MKRYGTAAVFAGLLVIFGASATKADFILRHPGSSFEDHFAAYDQTRWQKGDGWSNGTYMGCGWNVRTATVQNGRLALSVTGEPSAQERHSCAEFRTQRPYGYGTYAVNLKAVRADGVMTTVSHYTGPHFGDPWDEMTFGIPGKDTTKLEIGYVAKGDGRRDIVVDLGFDAAKEFHTYGIEWKANRIAWTVDGRVVHTAEGAPKTLPQTPGWLYLQFWNGSGASPWLKPFKDPGRPLTAEVAWVRFEEDTSALSN
ncbi:family 16 glycosylhydrolase [Azospirillum canadense]|uniref:family 16 glycosylhydrolase n=1 Tax=Azospirillum canadense TaxID=403962 RepID=UPI002226521B|nr:family 16 glycosylhydrolase [Azospirillum canadense]MCW2238792.1 endoglucanase [Azospirillum canadense]